MTPWAAAAGGLWAAAAALLTLDTAAAIFVLLLSALLFHRRPHHLPLPVGDAVVPMEGVGSVWGRGAGPYGLMPTRAPPPAPDLLPEALLAELPSLVGRPALRRRVEALQVVNLARLLRERKAVEAEALAERALLVYSFLGYAYLKVGRQRGTLELPPQLAMPMAAAATYLRRRVGIDYVTTVLTNCSWVDGEPVVGATFTGHDEERGFYQLHAHVERAAAPAVTAMLQARQL